MFRESLEINDDVWDCTLIKNMKEHKDTIVNPIYDWLDKDIWDYIEQEGIVVNPLYKKGYKRVGCIGCPMASYKEKQKEFNDYPAYKENYKRAFKRMLDKRRKAGKDDSKRGWQDEEGVFDWWIEKKRYEVEGQISIDEYLKEEES